MSHPYSDDDSSDSDSGIRFKTTNTRHHINNKSSYDNRVKSEHNYKSNRSRSKERNNKREVRSRSKDFRRRRHRSRTPERSKKCRRHKKQEECGQLPQRDHIKLSTSSSSSLEVRSKKSESREQLDTILLSEKKKPNMEADQYGPKLPPKIEAASSSTQVDDFIGPALPPLMISSANSNSQKENFSENKKRVLEKHIDKERKVIGPIIPPHLRSPQKTFDGLVISCSQIKSDESNSDDDIVGPLPAGEYSNNPMFIQLEERALEMKLNGLNKIDDDHIVREEWMLELPDVHSSNLGLGPRQFRAKGMPDMSDRSSWTDTPQDKLNKESTIKSPKSDIRKEAELKHIKERDLKQEKIVEKHKKKKKRDKSLLDIHQEKLNKKKKEECTSKSERRPFSRDIDLKANRFDEAQKKSILKKAQLLDSRFSSGNSKFL